MARQTGHRQGAIRVTVANGSGVGVVQGEMGAGEGTCQSGMSNAHRHQASRDGREDASAALGGRLVGEDKQMSVRSTSMSHSCHPGTN